MAVPVVAKIPAPMVAPTPSAVRCHLPRERRRPLRSRMSFSQSCTDFRRKSRLIEILGWGLETVSPAVIPNVARDLAGRAGSFATLGMTVLRAPLPRQGEGH